MGTSAADVDTDAVTGIRAAAMGVGAAADGICTASLGIGAATAGTNGAVVGTGAAAAAAEAAAPGEDWTNGPCLAMRPCSPQLHLLIYYYHKRPRK